MILVDTSAWFASVVPSDADHQVASIWMRQNTQPLLTTDYVIDETLTLLRVRGHNSRAMALGEGLFTDKIATVYYLTEEDIRLTWQVFRQFSDKGWSFTDCSSKVVMEKLGVNQAFSLDHHFRQFGSISVFP
jgi:uncharacterized protein